MGNQPQFQNGIRERSIASSWSARLITIESSLYRPFSALHWPEARLFQNFFSLFCKRVLNSFVVSLIKSMAV